MVLICCKTAYTGYVLDINTLVLHLIGLEIKERGGKVFRFAAIAIESASYLGRLIADVVSETEAEKVWVMGISFGCQTISEALTWLSEQSDLFMVSQNFLM